MAPQGSVLARLKKKLVQFKNPKTILKNLQEGKNAAYVSPHGLLSFFHIKILQVTKKQLSEVR